MNDLNTINNILLENINKLNELNVNDAHSRDEIMKSNAISSTAKTIIQLRLLKLAIEKRNDEINGSNTLAIEG